MARSRKPKYSDDEKRARLHFARPVVRLSKKALRAKLNMSLDGVVLSMPPVDETQRFNYCWDGFRFMWRKPEESAAPELDGADSYSKQVPISRAIPLWGGLSEGGFEAVLWHEKKKTDNEQWAAAVRAGQLTSALRKINPGRHIGQWTVLCDNESFLRHPNSMRAYAAKHVGLWGVPARSPDLNPIEMFWGWVRRQLRLKDLEDLRQKRPTLNKTAYTARVKTLFRTQKAQTMAKRFAARLRTTCKEVILNSGAAASN